MKVTTPDAPASRKSDLPVRQRLLSPDSQERVAAAKSLKREGIGRETNNIDALFEAIGKEADPRSLPYLFWPLQYCVEPFDEGALTRLLTLTGDSRPEIWYNAAFAISNGGHTKWGEVLAARKLALGETEKMRLAFVSGDIRSQLTSSETRNPRVYEFLLPLIDCHVEDRGAHEVFARACENLAFYGNKDAVPILVTALKDLQRMGRCQGGWLSPGYALKSINRLTGKDYGGIGQKLDGMGTKEADAVNWAEVIPRLAAEYPLPAAAKPN